MTHPNFRFKEESTLLTYQHIFFRKQVSRKTRFIVYGLSRINRIIKDRVVFNLGPKLSNGPNKRIWLLFNTLFFFRAGSQTSNDFQNSGEITVYRKMSINSSKIKVCINIIFSLRTINNVCQCVCMNYIYKSHLAWCKLTVNSEVVLR